MGPRYHLVSIAAVLLALAVGIVLGTSVLRGPVVRQVNDTSDASANHNDRVRAEVTTLRRQVEADQQLARKAVPGLVDGKLAGENVVIVQAPGTETGLRKHVVTELERADATIAGRVSVTRKYLANDQAGVLGELASRLAPRRTKPQADSPYERSAAALAAGMVGQRGTTAGTAGGAGGDMGGDMGGGTASSVPVLAGFETGGYITTSGHLDGKATLAVVLAPPDRRGVSQPAAANRAIVALARALDRQAGKHGGGAVVAGPVTAARHGGLIQALRGSAAARKVSTVDFADTATGRVATVLALAEKGAGTGHYGVGPGAHAYLPAMNAPAAGRR